MGPVLLRSYIDEGAGWTTYRPCDTELGFLPGSLLRCARPGAAAAGRLPGARDRFAVGTPRRRQALYRRGVHALPALQSRCRYAGRQPAAVDSEGLLQQSQRLALV